MAVRCSGRMVPEAPGGPCPSSEGIDVNISTTTGLVQGVGQAHAKTILLGEHTVVHGTPAIAFPLPALPVRAVARVLTSGETPLAAPDGQFRFSAGDTPAPAGTLSGPRVAVEEALRRWGLADARVDILVDCDIPLARGLGSSAACAGAAVRAVADLYGRVLDEGTLYDLVQCGEQVEHGRASGIDASTVLAAGPIRFHEGRTRPLAIDMDAALIIADTGVPGSTQRAVAGVRRVLEADPARARRLLDRARELIAAAEDQLATGRAEELGATMSRFQELLAELGVSTPHIDTLVSAAREAGAFGAKLTGAGLGGCVLALTTPAAADTVGAALRHAGAAQTWTVTTGSLAADVPIRLDSGIGTHA